MKLALFSLLLLIGCKKDCERVKIIDVKICTYEHDGEKCIVLLENKKWYVGHGTVGSEVCNP